MFSLCFTRLFALRYFVILPLGLVLELVKYNFGAKANTNEEAQALHHESRFQLFEVRI
jgi:hypothetical protein